jgi:hypothetical protein
LFFKLDLADISEIQKIENSLQISSPHLPTPPPPPSSSSFCFLSPKHSNTQSDNTLQPFQTINNNINSVIRQPFSNLTNQSNIQTNFPSDILDDDDDDSDNDDEEEYDDDDVDDDENEFNGEDGAPPSSTTTNATILTSSKTTSPSNSTTTTVDGTTPSSSTTTTGDETAPSSSTTVDGAAKPNSTSTLVVKDISGTGDILLRKRFGGKHKPKGTQKVFFERDKTKRTRIKNRRRPTLFKLVSFSF